MRTQICWLSAADPTTQRTIDLQPNIKVNANANPNIERTHTRPQGEKSEGASLVGAGRLDLRVSVLQQLWGKKCRD